MDLRPLATRRAPGARRRLASLGLVAVALLAAAPTTGALYIVTPLSLSGGDGHADVGDEVDLVVAPNSEHENGTADKWAGRTIVLKYGWDPAEGTDRSEGDETEHTWETRVIGEITLDAEGKGAFTWTVPADVDDRNIVLTVGPAEGDPYAYLDMAIGDAEPMYRLAASTGEPVETPMEEDTGGEPPQESQDDARPTPGVGVLVLAAGLVGAALVARRR